MKPDVKAKGTWVHRFSIRFFTGVLTVLVFWLLGFLVQDIRAIRGPNYAVIEKRHLAPTLVNKQEALAKQIADLTRRIKNQTEKQRVLGDSSRNLQQTMTQLLELQKIGMQRNVTFSEREQTNFTNSLNLFLENQKRYQELSRTISQTLEQKQELVREKEQIDRELDLQRKEARTEYQTLSMKHRLRLAFLQLAILLPILAVAAVVIARKRNSIYFPLLLAFGAATLIKVAVVIHEYFPTKYFKYVLILALLLAVARLLIHFIRTIAFPKQEWLVKQYREAYERFLCPVCEYPIRTGPRRFLFWTRRTVNKMVVPTSRRDQEQPYVCPSCGSTLYEECPSCQKVRHALLPHCAHCGAEKEIA
ncbi:MAG: hypothetical protein GXP31_07740 [Kiritimatiellaeota bacterium]|nr:hypothetical protein [Kiritimatiellota bacterium]